VQTERVAGRKNADGSASFHVFRWTDMPEKAVVAQLRFPSGNHTEQAADWFDSHTKQNLFGTP
jgi:hypothetical protein